MQIEIPASLRGRIYIDSAKKVIYVDSHTILKDSIFITLYQELKTGEGYRFEVNPDTVKELRNTDQKKTYETGEEILVELEKIIRSAVLKKVSDIHIEVRDNKTSIFFREDGLLKKVYEYTKEEGDKMAQSLFSNAVSTSHTSYSETDYQYGNIRNASFFPSDLEGIRLQRGMMLGGHFVVLRLLYKNSTSGLNIVKEQNFKETVERTFERYGYTKATVDLIEPVLRGAEGLILISGPTGSGKSTALKLMLELIHLLYPTKSIFTIEDPPEYRILGAKQLPVPEGGSFSEVLKVALRSDPDIIMVGEIRDETTARVIVDAVLTGHMVLSTIHARDTYTILERLRDLKIDTEELIKAELVKVAISQRLVPAVCENCKEKVIFPDGIEGYVGRGCEKCAGTGMRGRVVVEEAINHIELMRYGIERIKEYLKTNRRDLISNAIRLVKAGKISPQAAMGFVGYFSSIEYNLLSIARNG